MAIIVDIPSTRRLLRGVWRRNKPRAVVSAALSLALALLPLALLAAAGVAAFYIGQDGKPRQVVLAAAIPVAVAVLADWIRRRDLPRIPAAWGIKPYRPIKSGDL